MRFRKSVTIVASARISSTSDSSKADRWRTGRIQLSNGNRGANGARATKPPASAMRRRRSRRSCRTTSHQTQRSFICQYIAEPASSSVTMIGMMGVAISCECGCSSDAPAASP